MTRSFVATLMLASMVACVAQRPITGDQACPCAPGWSCDTPRNVCVEDSGNGGSGGTSGGGSGGTSGGGSGGTSGGGGGGTSGGSTGGFGGTQPDVCAATCGTPAGTVATLSTVEAVYAALEGRWGMCGGPWGFGAPADVIGVEFGPASTEPTANGSTVGGDLYYLVSTPSGPQRGSGFAYQLKYDVSQSGSLFQLNIHPTPNSGFGGSVRYSPCPKELELNLMYQPTGRILVPIGDGSGFGMGTGGASGMGAAGAGGTGGPGGASGAGGTSS